MVRAGAEMVRLMGAFGGAMLLAGVVVPTSSYAQIGGVMGSATGSYCKFKKKNQINVDTWLPLGSKPEYARNMTLRRLSEMTRSKGFTSFVTEVRPCVILLINRRPTNVRCNFIARMESSGEAESELKSGEERFNADKIMELTESEAASYPRRSGILNYKNQCVIE